MKQLEDPELKSLKELLRYGGRNDSFMIIKPKSALYTMIIHIGKKNDPVCIVDEKSVRINSLYKNEVHKEEISKWADRIGKISFEYKADKTDTATIKYSHACVANWRLNKKVADVVPKDVSFTEAIQTMATWQVPVETGLIARMREYMQLPF